jgi:serine/threonine protein kinase
MKNKKCLKLLIPTLHIDLIFLKKKYNFFFSSLKHPNLVHFLGVAQKPDNIIYIVTEFMAKGSLLHYLTTRGRSVISQKDLLSFAM